MSVKLVCVPDGAAIGDKVGWCRLTLSKAELKAAMLSALETSM